MPALWQGGIAGSPYTDLYPSIWSLWATEDWWGQWRTGWLNTPDGQNWYPSTLLLGTAIIPLKSLVPIGTLYNWLMIGSRCLGCFSFYLAGRAWGSSHFSGLLFMVVVSMSPMIHGFAVEGIIEGTQIWPLGFWLWSIHRSSTKLSIFFGCLIILSNWYWACIWGILQTIRVTKQSSEAPLLIGPILLTSPWWFGFLGQGTTDPISSDVLRMMGFQFGFPTPHWLTSANPFAQSNYIGWVLIFWSLMIIRRKSTHKPLFIVGLGFVLSLGLSWMQSFPILSAIRFPYRLHLMTLIGLVLWIGCNTKWRSQHRKWIWLILLEQILCPSIDALIPISQAHFPEYVAMIDGPILEVPGPLNRPPGVIDPSKPRSRYLFYYQTEYAQPSGWRFSFNGLHTPTECFAETRIIDPHATPKEKATLGSTDCWKGIDWVVIHNTNTALNPRLIELGFTQQTNEVPVVWKRSQTQ